MNTNHTLESLLGTFRQSFDAAAKTAFEPVCGVRRSRDEALDFTHREAIKAVLDAIGYQFPIDPEREAYEKWLSDKQAKPEPYDAWKAGREELRKQSGPAAPKEDPPWIEWKGGHCPIPDTVKRWEYRCRDGYICSSPAAPSRYSPACWEHQGSHENHFVAYRVLDWGSTPETFEAHGHTWFKHKPKDFKPEYLPDDAEVNWLLDYELEGSYTHDSLSAGRLAWGAINVIGWRYAE